MPLEIKTFMVKEYVYQSLILNVILIVITAWITRKLFSINSDFNEFKSNLDTKPPIVSKKDDDSLLANIDRKIANLKDVYYI